MRHEGSSLLIRVDANAYIGTGHLMRCLALAQGWKDRGGTVIFLTAPGAQALESRLQAERMEIFHLATKPGSTDDASQLVDLARQRNVTIAVVDGYHFGTEYQQIIKMAGLRLVLVDDNGHSDYYYADFVLNQNIDAHEGLYKNRESYTGLLLGTRYVLLRREFLAWMGWRREVLDEARKVLVTMGGSDLHNVTLKVVEALQLVEVSGLEATIVVGGINPNYQRLEFAIRNSRFPILLQMNASSMPMLMAWADTAIASAGSTSWELTFMRLPSLLVVAAENHRAIAEGLGKAGVSLNLGWHEDLSHRMMARELTEVLTSGQKRSLMVKSSQGLVDGEGVDRVLMRIRDEKIRLRSVREDDCLLLWEWANEPVTRSVSFSPDPIPWEEHERWFNAKVRDANCIFYIAVNEQDIPVGQVRHDITGNEAVISVSIDKKWRRGGYGSEIIRLASLKLFSTSEVTAIHAYMKHENEASRKAFVKSGYSEIGETMVQGCKASHLVFGKANEYENLH